MRADLEKLLGSVDPAQALPEIAALLKKVLPLVAEEDRLNFVVNLIGGAGDDKVASLVHL
jgi:hypothetical protein